MKSYLEIKVPISYNVPWFSELREALKDMPVSWQKGYYHITLAFIDDTQHLADIEGIMHKFWDDAQPVNITFDKLDVFTVGNGMQIIHLGTSNIPKGFKTLVDDIRCKIVSTNSDIQSDFKLHVTLGRVSEPEADINDIGFLIDEIDFTPISLTLNEVEYRVFRGRSIYKATLN